MNKSVYTPDGDSSAEPALERNGTFRISLVLLKCFSFYILVITGIFNPPFLHQLFKSIIFEVFVFFILEILNNLKIFKTLNEF